MLRVRVPSSRPSCEVAQLVERVKEKLSRLWGRSSNWLERQFVTLEAVGSNPIGPAMN